MMTSMSSGLNLFFLPPFSVPIPRGEEKGGEYAVTRRSDYMTSKRGRSKDIRFKKECLHVLMVGFPFPGIIGERVTVGQLLMYLISLH